MMFPGLKVDARVLPPQQRHGSLAARAAETILSFAPLASRLRGDLVYAARPKQQCLRINVQLLKRSLTTNWRQMCG